MAYYEPQGWQAPATRQVSWEQPVPPSRSGTFMSRLRCRGTEKKETNTHSLCLLQAPARSLSARKCRPSPLSLTVWTRILFYIQIVVFRGPPAVDEFRRAGMCKAAGSGVDILEDRANVVSKYRGRSGHRQPRQEWKAVGCSPEGLHAPDDGPPLSRLRYDFPVT